MVVVAHALVMSGTAHVLVMSDTAHALVMSGTAHAQVMGGLAHALVMSDTAHARAMGATTGAPRTLASSRAMMLGVAAPNARHISDGRAASSALASGGGICHVGAWRTSAVVHHSCV